MATEIKSKIEELSPTFKETLESKNDYREGQTTSYERSKDTTYEGTGKGSPNAPGLVHITPSDKAVAYSAATIRHQIATDDEKVGNKYDRGEKGYNGIDGGREYLKKISKYTKQNQYPGNMTSGNVTKINWEPKKGDRR